MIRESSGTHILRGGSPSLLGGRKDGPVVDPGWRACSLPRVTALAAIVFWADCISEPSLFAPGDSFMFFVLFHAIGGLIWLVVWIGTTWPMAADLIEFRGAGILTAILVLTVVCLGLSQFPTPILGSGDRGLAGLLLIAAVPGLRGYLGAIGTIDLRRRWFGDRPVLSLILVAVATISGATFLWWPRELVTMIGCVLNVRVGPPGTLPSLLIRLAAATLLAANSICTLAVYLHVRHHRNAGAESN